jgi:hypothetical protein
MRSIKAGRGQAFDAVALSRLILNEDFEASRNRMPHRCEVIIQFELRFADRLGRITPKITVAPDLPFAEWNGQALEPLLGTVRCEKVELIDAVAGAPGMVTLASAGKVDLFGSKANLPLDISRLLIPRGLVLEIVLASVRLLEGSPAPAIGDASGEDLKIDSAGQNRPCAPTRDYAPNTFELNTASLQRIDDVIGKPQRVLMEGHAGVLHLAVRKVRFFDYDPLAIEEEVKPDPYTPLDRM